MAAAPPLRVGQAFGRLPWFDLLFFRARRLRAFLAMSRILPHRDLRVGRSFLRTRSEATGDSVEATYDQGMLEITVKGAVQPEPQPQQVKIKTGGLPQAIEAQAEPADQS